jgi:cytochrome P450
MGRDPHYFPQPEAFRPERYLPGNPYAPTHPDAWRPYEKGPRNCIGQDLAMIEGRVAMALVARYFRMEDDYLEPTEAQLRQFGKVEFDGNRAYQIFQASAKPKDGLPCRVFHI